MDVREQRQKRGQCVECGAYLSTRSHYPECRYASGLNDQFVTWKMCMYQITPAMYECILACKGVAPYVMMQVVQAVKLLRPREQSAKPTYTLCEAIVRNVWSGYVHFVSNIDGFLVQVQVPGEVM